MFSIKIARYLILIICFVYTSVLYAQADTVWTKKFGGPNDKASTLIQSSDGNLVFCGSVLSSNGEDYNVMLTKIDTEGNTIWTRSIGDTTSEYAHHFIQTDDGSYIIVGEVRYNTFGLWRNPDVLVIKTNSTGEVIWRMVYGFDNKDEVGWQVYQRSYDEIMVLAVSDEDSWLLSASTDGDTLWTRKYEGDFYTQFPTSSSHIKPVMIETTDSGWLIVNTRIGYNGDLLVIKTNTDGDIEWTNDEISTSYLDVPVASFQTDQNEFQIIGYSDAYFDQDIFMAHLSSSGQLIWQRYISATERTGRWYHAIKSNDTTYMVAGRAKSAGLTVYSVTDSGDILWKFIGSDNMLSYGRYIVKHNDEEYTVLGTIGSSDPDDSDIWLLHLQISDSPIGVEEDYAANIVQYELLPNYPNPFNPATTLQFNLPMQASTSLKIYDVRGKEVTALVNNSLNPGNYQIVWNGIDQNGEQVPAGIYIACMRTPGYTKSIKMVLLK